MKDIKVYIGTLYVGENEIEECKKSIKAQTFKNITHEIFSFLPNKEAHDTLYSRFMELQNDYDYFIKLDADMVLIRDTIVDELVEIFQEDKDLDHAVFSVHDWYSDSNIMGMHMFSNRVKWIISPKETLFVDRSPKRNGKRVTYSNSPAPVAYHSPNPSLEEAFMFGYHRALKVVQRDRLLKKTSGAKFQLELLQKAWNCLLKERNQRRLAVIVGAEYVFQNQDSKTLVHKGNNETLKHLIDTINDIEIESFILSHTKDWKRYNLRYIKYVLLPKIYRIFLVGFKKFRQS
ncbi:hypothetical protein [Sulfurovum sp.]|jgi:hypothetical protein|uniref:hypothetical protein n=1 Tax=Sulfurovum sp. TaxID=1969726 RepID=UPI002A36EDFE|nr:hypothetical protein [Sulfurovum sp.]MDY0403004.1 hypothetical protein [Sulfurovum sp.]